MKFNLKVLSLGVLALLGLATGFAQVGKMGQRLTPSEIDAIAAVGGGTGTSGVNGIQTRILKGDPNKTGLYTIQLTIPANTKN